MAKNPLSLSIVLLAVAAIVAGGILLFTQYRHGTARQPVPDTVKTVGTTSIASKAPKPEAAPYVHSPAPSRPPGKNAADICKNAFALFNKLTGEEKKMLGNPREEVDADEAAALFAKIQPIMEMLRTAKDAEYCDWAMGPISVESPMPQMGLVMSLGKVVRWNAASRFTSEPEGAIADLAVQAWLGQSVASQALIGNLVAGAQNASVIDLIRANSDVLTPGATAQALKLVQGLAIEDSLAAAMHAEAQCVKQFADMVVNSKDRDEILEGFMIGYGKPMTQEEINTLIKSLPADCEWLVQMEKDFAQKAAMQDAEFNTWWTQVKNDAKSRPIAAISLGAFDGIRDRLRRSAVNRSMLNAGLNILQSGQPALASVTDPTTGQPFTYVATPDGFELRSAFRYKEKPVTMKFATPTPKPPPSP